LLETAKQLTTLNPQEVLTEIRKKVDEFVDGAPQFDDLTMLGFYYVGAEKDDEGSAVESAAVEI
jgi:serine phosphatase RsbU (regulator of sigma subunit)